jgi:hypothetical protein
MARELHSPVNRHARSGVYAKNWKEMLVNKPLLLTIGALLVGALNVAAPKEAAADIRVRIGGGVHVGTRWHRPVYRPYYRPRYAVGGSIWVGRAYPVYGYRTYAAPPPPPVCECGPSGVPSYYPGYYGAPATYAAAAPAPERLPRLGIGGFAGGIDVEGESGSDVGLFGRLRLTEGLLLELEVGATQLDRPGATQDDRVAAGLVYEIGARNRWAPYLLAAVGGTDSPDSEQARSFGEIGVGLRWALTRHLHLAFDLRAGAQENAAGASDVAAAARIATPIDATDEEEQRYTRGRLSAMLYF